MKALLSRFPMFPLGVLTFSFAATAALGGCARAAEPPILAHAAAAPTEEKAASAEPIEGTAAPDFVALGHDGNNVALSRLRGRTVVLYFYARDETPNAIREASDFRDAWPELRRQGVVIVGVSTDTTEAHKEFAERHRLPFPLVSDADGAVARAYGVPASYGLADRRTFVIGPDGTLEKVYRNVDLERHVAEVVSHLQ